MGEVRESGGEGQEGMERKSRDAQARQKQEHPHTHPSKTLHAHLAHAVERGARVADESEQPARERDGAEPRPERVARAAQHRALGRPRGDRREEPLRRGARDGEVLDRVDQQCGPGGEERRKGEVVGHPRIDLPHAAQHLLRRAAAAAAGAAGRREADAFRGHARARRVGRDAAVGGREQHRAAERQQRERAGELQAERGADDAGEI